MSILSRRSILAGTAAGAAASAFKWTAPARALGPVAENQAASFYRYLNLTPQGQRTPESVYVLPTTAGTITAVCSAPTFTTRFTSSCERVLSTLKPTAGDVLSIGVDPGYALQLNRILGQLNGARRSAGPGLRSSRVRTRRLRCCGR